MQIQIYLLGTSGTLYIPAGYKWNVRYLEITLVTGTATSTRTLSVQLVHQFNTQSAPMLLVAGTTSTASATTVYDLTSSYDGTATSTTQFAVPLIVSSNDSLQFNASVASGDSYYFILVAEESPE